MGVHYTIGAYDAQMSCRKLLPGGMSLDVAQRRAADAFRGEDYSGLQLLIFKHMPGKEAEIVACRLPRTSVWAARNNESRVVGLGLEGAQGSVAALLREGAPQ